MKEKVIFFAPVEEKYLSRWEYYQVDFEALKLMFDNVTVCNSIWQVVKNLRGTHLIFCWWWHQSAPIVLLAKLLGIKTQVTGAIHMFDLSGSNDFFSKSVVYRVATRLALALADSNLFISRDQYLQVTSHLRVNNPMVVVSSLRSNSKSSKSFIVQQRALLRQECRDTNKTRFFTVVWHTQEQYRRKGVFETLGALALLKDMTDFEFIWIIAGGDGDGLTSLTEKIADLGLQDNVMVRVDITEEEKRDLFMLSDLYIQPSWYEGFGNAVLEANSNGLPALVSRYTAQPEVVGDSGFIAMQVSPQKICRELQAFLALDDKQRAILERDVLEYVERNFAFKNRFEALVTLSQKMGLKPRKEMT